MTTPATKHDHDTRFRNVTLYSGGQSEHGTLYMTKHHLKFTYLPKSPKNNELVSNGPQQSAPPLSTANSTLTNGTEGTEVKQVDQEARKSQAPTSQPRPKEIWVPYPMINFCLLRPSHSLINQTTTSGDHGAVEPASDDDDLFPPVFGTASYERPSTDSARLAPFASPARPSTPVGMTRDVSVVSESGRQPAIRIRRRDFQMMAFHFHQSTPDSSSDDAARQAFFTLRSRCCIHNVDSLHAFHFEPPKQESASAGVDYDARREYERMGIGDKAADGPGSAWRLSTINEDYSYSATYPNVLCVPAAVSDNMLKYGGSFRSRSRIPCLTYLHSNGGSISRSSQPMVGLQNKRNPQDEKLVSAIFLSHTAPLQTPEDSTILPTLPSQDSDASEITPEKVSSALPKSSSEAALDEGADGEQAPARRKVYGSTRQNLIVDARPKINALANRATGGGIEDIANYVGNNGVPIQKVFLNIANIHVMRASLEKIVESLANADYLNMKPNQETLRRSGWLGHIAGLLDGSEMVARVVGLGGSHVLVHCSDGWDRTAQVAALAQVMLDPHCRTLRGFTTLIQKDFLSFGHKFRDRDGVEGSEKWFEIENERIAPSPRAREGNVDPSSLNVLGSRALSGAKNWFEKNRQNLFRQQNGSRESLPDLTARSSSPPPNPVIHSPPSIATKEENSHRMSEKEIAPIFHQFLDAVYQLQHQNPDAFEFNERFLRRLFYHTYACQYGEFLFNTEKNRLQQMSKLPSVWGHFFSRRQEFTNPNFVPQVEDPLLFPKHLGQEREVEVRWWSTLFRCVDEDMNVPRTTLSAESSTASTSLAPSLTLDERVVANGGTSENTSPAPAGSGIKETKSTPSLSTMRESFAAGVSSLTMRFQSDKSEDASSQTAALPNSSLSNPSPTTTDEGKVVATPLQPTSTVGDNPAPSTTTLPEDLAVAPSPSIPEAPTPPDDGDPLGVSANVPSRAVSVGSPSGSTRLDSTAFASQNAFHER